MKNRSVLLFLWFIATVSAQAELRLRVVFTDNMVLQRSQPVAIWGDAAPGRQISVHFGGQSVEAIASEKGAWRCYLEPMTANAQPQELRIASSKDGNVLTFKNVLVGEVWLAGGQSNMGWPLSQTEDWQTYRPVEPNPSIRLLKIPVTEFGEIDRDHTRWVIYDSGSTPGFSAVAFFFATELYRRLEVPVGIIGSYRGGTWNENWMTPASIKNEPKLKYLFEEYEEAYGAFKDEAEYEAAYQDYLVKLEEWKAKGGWSSGQVPFAPTGPKAHRRPSGLYECMIKPLQPYTIKGVIWYQGEGNSFRHEEFRTLFPSFVKGWRKTWENPELPFYFVQLPPFKAQQWPHFRQAQLDCARAVPHCGMVVAEGCGDFEDIHPRVKKPIGDRLAIAATAEVYGHNHVPYGPMFKSVDFRGGKAEVHFDYTGEGLMVNSDSIADFEIAGRDKKFVQAKVELRGPTLVLWSDQIQEPAHVRYAFAPYPEMVLFNKEGLPASPFTTELQ